MVLQLKACGIEPTKHVLDTECLKEFKQAIEKNRMKYQLVPLHNHRRNIAEKFIQAFKDHFIAVLCGTAANFLTQLWCWIL